MEGEPAIPAQSAERMLGQARVQKVVEKGNGDVVGLGRSTREPSEAMIRQLKYRDRECRFPGCGARRFLQAHHVAWRRRGGRTVLPNLILVCTFHHRLVHEYRWTVSRDSDGTVRWFHPRGRQYRAGPGPPQQDPTQQSALAVAGF